MGIPLGIPRGAPSPSPDAGLTPASSFEEMLKTGVVRTNRLLQRIELERQLLNAILKLVNFLIYFTCFAAALSSFSPADEIARVHDHLESHFALGSVSGISNFAQLYYFLEVFDSRSAELQPSSAQYWCEKRYAEFGWNDTLGVPVASCPSPRQNSLGVSGRPSWTRASSPGFNQTPPTPDPWIYTTTPDPSVSTTREPCFDDEAALREALGNPEASCVEEAKTACNDKRLGSICRKSCGYCAPFMYEQVEKFTESQLTILPTVVYQTRWETMPCKGFAKAYREQVPNMVLSKNPGLDGERMDALVDCVDRSQLSTREYAHKLPNLESGGPAIDATKRLETEDDLRIYPKMLVHPRRDVAAMKQMQWFDGLTSTATVSTVVYTPKVEIFTVMAVDFDVDAAGGIKSHVSFMSYKELGGDSARPFIACMFLAMIFSQVGLMTAGFNMYFNPQLFKSKAHLFEMLVQLVVFLYVVVLLISWAAESWLKKDFDNLLTDFVTLPSMIEADIHEVLRTFFAVRMRVDEMAKWVFNNHVVSYIILYMLIVHAVICLTTHPKLKLTIRALQIGLESIAHFLAVFVVMFLLLAFLAHWSFGGYIHEYATFSGAVSLQLRKLFGELLVLDGAEGRLHGSKLFLYWLYTLGFVVLVFWGLAYFFLAIVLDTFRTVVQEQAIAGKSFACNFFWDLADAVYTPLLLISRGWPTQERLFRKLKRVASSDVPYGDLQKVMVTPRNFATVTELERFLALYNWKLGGSLLSTPGCTAGDQGYMSPKAPDPCAPSRAPPSTPPRLPTADEAAVAAPVAIPSLTYSTQSLMCERVELMISRSLIQKFAVTNRTPADWEGVASELACVVTKDVHCIVRQALQEHLATMAVEKAKAAGKATSAGGSALRAAANAGTAPAAVQEGAGAAGGAASGSPTTAGTSGATAPEGTSSQEASAGGGAAAVAVAMPGQMEEEPSEVGSEEEV
eukprot:gnl/TRDRNA2_/TRDRNA2_190715_c0_seq1.p1 gnl/TRDRNA2_/TRDRNA2_190715_c0~~gnl/TRDRNA2_/TRDRNA2_190715_c0_seq1.p1  ORF type:complete len:965 (+),score=179.44 gnl/TRDRNA2_/TRDRNA2_190715_c0_seq1:58-2952(+)